MHEPQHFKTHRWWIWSSSSCYYISFLYCYTVHLLLTSFQVQLELGRYTECPSLLSLIRGVLDSDEKVDMYYMHDNYFCLWNVGCNNYLCVREVLSYSYAFGCIVTNVGSVPKYNMCHSVNMPCRMLIHLLHSGWGSIRPFATVDNPRWSGMHLGKCWSHTRILTNYSEFPVCKCIPIWVFQYHPWRIQGIPTKRILQSRTVLFWGTCSW